MRKIQTTKDYRLFNVDLHNRKLDAKKFRRLRKSIQEHGGLLPEWPIVCRRDEKAKLWVIDGHHRLYLAEELGYPVHYVVRDAKAAAVDVAMINSAQRPWGIRDYAECFAEQGMKEYQEVLDFADAHHIAVGKAAALLAGTISFGNVDGPFKTGAFRVNDREWAERVASIYSPLAGMAACLRTARFLEACMAVGRVEKFDTKRLVRAAERCREKLQPYATRDAYLDMIEEVYNFAQRKLLGVKADALMAMRERKIAKPKAGGSQQGEESADPKPEE